MTPINASLDAAHRALADADHQLTLALSLDLQGPSGDRCREWLAEIKTAVHHAGSTFDDAGRSLRLVAAQTGPAW